MIISIINFTEKKDEEVQCVLRAVNRQIQEDFEPYWHMGAGLRLEGRASKIPSVKRTHPEELRGDAIIYLWDKEDVDDALGYHEDNFMGLPFGFVFLKLAEAIDEPWSVTLSHEALELIGDANSNTFAAGPHPEEPDRLVFHWYEMSDAVQAQRYKIDHEWVSNFVLPLYFTIDEERGSRTDFLGCKNKKGETLKSFGVNDGGYIGFFDPSINDHVTYELPGDSEAKRRMELKRSVKLGRRGMRYRQLSAHGEWKQMTRNSLHQAQRNLEKRPGNRTGNRLPRK